MIEEQEAIEIEQYLYTRALEASNGNITEAAYYLGATIEQVETFIRSKQ